MLHLNLTAEGKINSLEKATIISMWRRYLHPNLDPFPTELADELLERRWLSFDQHKSLHAISVRTEQVRELLIIVVETLPMSAFLSALDKTHNEFIADFIRGELERASLPK